MQDLLKELPHRHVYKVVVILIVVAIAGYFAFESQTVKEDVPSVIVGEPSDIVIYDGLNRAITGRASVTDGDTLEINEISIRLHGIDAPELKQSCSKQGKKHPCGYMAKLALAKRIENSIIVCQPKDRDLYGRVVAVCHKGGEDLSAWMVSQGWAVVNLRYSMDYIRQQKAAAAAKHGIWQGDFINPWDWRRGQRL